MCNTRLKSQSGFTLIELVAVMVLLGIISVYAIPRFSGTDIFEAHAAQDQIIAAARLAQQRAMYDHATGACYSLDIRPDPRPDRAGDLISVRDAGGNLVGPSPEWRTGLYVEPDIPITTTILPNTPLAPTVIYFNGLGSPLTGAGLCANGTPSSLRISIGNPELLSVSISEVGFIR